jgi:hypothetical protein
MLHQSFIAVYKCLSHGTYWKGCSIGCAEAETTTSGFSTSNDVD